MFELVGLGNPVYDIIITPFSKTDGRVLSGCSTNGCLAARRLGLSPVGLVGRVGVDYADRLLSDLTRYGVTASLNSGDSETGGFRLEYDERGNRTLKVLGIAHRITPKDIPEEFMDTKFFLIGPILGEIDLELIGYLRTSSKGRLFLDPQGLLRLVGEDGRIIHKCEKGCFSKILDLVDFVKPNEPESVTITNTNDSLEALRRLRMMGSAFPIITLAERGSIFTRRDDMYRIPAYQTRAIDPTGAGDVYAGSFIFEFLRTEDYVESALFASAASSLMVEQVGPDFKLELNEVKRRRESIRPGLSRTSTL